MATFEEQVEFGAVGEQILLELLRTHPFTRAIRDVRADERFRQRGIDFVWESGHGGGALNVEVKYERAWTGNLFLEHITGRQQRPGWFKTSEADVVVYGFADAGRWLVLELKLLRSFVERIGTGTLGTGSAATHEAGEEVFRSVGWLLPVEKIYEQDRACLVTGMLQSLRDSATYAPAARTIIIKGHEGRGIAGVRHVDVHNIYVEFEAEPGRICSFMRSIYVSKRKVLDASTGNVVTPSAIDAWMRVGM